MSHLLASLALVATTIILFAIIGYLLDHDRYKQYCLRTARCNYLMEEDHEEWIKNSNTEFGYRDALEDERKADKGKTNFCQVDTVDDQGRRTKSTLTWDEDGESKSETVLL